MDPEMITAIRSGDGNRIKQLSKDKPYIFTKRSPQRNTVLHIAVRYGNSSVVREILNFQDSFLSETNCKGETPLHLAMLSNNEDVFYTLLNYNHSGNSEIGEVHILRTPDNEGNLPLHAAAKNNNQVMAKAMLRHDPGLVTRENNAGQSPLSIAIDSSSFDSAFLIIREGPKGHNYGNDLIKLLSALILRKQNYYCSKLLRDAVNVIGTNEEGRNLLHYAAVAGNDSITKELLLANPSLAYETDRHGQTPLHLAARNGQLISLKYLINTCPDATEVLDEKKRNILHTAAEHGQVNIVLYLLKMRELEDFINSCDEDCNTPLHLAAMNVDINVINILSKNVKVRIRATNNENQTALQVAEASEDQEKTFQKHLTIKALKAAYADQALDAEDILDNSRFKRTSNIDGNSGHKQIAQTLSVIATLVASFTFSAAFTIPDSLTSSETGLRFEDLVKKRAFVTFVLTDIIAMTSSMTAAIVLFWAFWRRRTGAFINALPLAIGLVSIGLVSMTIAFVTGLFLLLYDIPNLAILVCSIGAALPFTFYVFAPLLLSKSGFAQTEDNMFAFTLRKVKIFFLKRP